MIEAILLLALAALFAAHRRLVGRIAELERRIAGQARPAIAPDPEPAPAPSTVIVRQAVRKKEKAESLPPGPADESTAASTRESLASIFERLVGGRMLIWVGGIALALAGLFLVRYAVEIGLIGPATRMVMAAVFGLLLVGVGELARWRLPDDPRVGQALVGAGVLILYAAAYASHVLYDLIGLGTAFAAMAGVAGAALLLSLRHGAPAAALGLVGGLLTPLIVGDPDAGPLPLLIYLALLNVAVFAVTIRTGQRWLAWMAKLGTLLWTASLIVRGDGDALTAGLFVLVYAIATSLALSEKGEPYPSFAPTFALLQLGVLVGIGDFETRPWALFFALAAAGFALAGRRRGMLAIPPRAMAAALALIVSHSFYSQGLSAPEPRAVGLFASLVTLLFASAAWLGIERGPASRRWTWIFCIAIVGPAVLLRTADPGLLFRPVWGALFALLALAPAALTYRLRLEAQRDATDRSPLVVASGAAAILAIGAAFDLFAPPWVPIAYLIVALGVLAAARRIGDGGLARLSMVVSLIGAIAAVRQTPSLWQELLASLGGAPALVAGIVPPGEALLLFAAPALLLFALWRWARGEVDQLARSIGVLAGAFALLAAYILFKQIFAIRDEPDFVARGFAERTLLTQGLFFAGWLLPNRPRLDWLAGVSFALTALAAARFAWFDLLILNPAHVRQNVGALPVLNLLVAAYLGSAFWLYEARRRARLEAESSIFFGLFLAAIVVGTGLLVRQLFQGAILTGAGMPRAEFYGYSLAGLLLSVGLLLFGWKRGDTPLRVAGLALLTATMVKVFLVDAGELEGVLRILSFLGLGIALIGMGKLYGTLLGRPVPS